MIRTHGWHRRGAPLREKVPHAHWRTMTFLAYVTGLERWDQELLDRGCEALAIDRPSGRSCCWLTRFIFKADTLAAEEAPERVASNDNATLSQLDPQSMQCPFTGY